MLSDPRPQHLAGSAMLMLAPLSVQLKHLVGKQERLHLAIAAWYPARRSMYLP